MLLAVVIVNYKVKYFAAQAVEAALAATRGMDARIYLVDNASGDDSIAYLRARYPEVCYIQNDNNEGFAKANNRAVRASQSRYVLLLNPDTIIGPDTLRKALDHMEQNERTAAVGVRMHDARGNFLPESKRGSVSLWSCACRFLGLARCFPKSRLFNRYYAGWLDKGEMHSVGLLSGAFMLLRRKAFEEAGLLDERYFMYGEDIDLSYTLRKLGYRCDYLPLPILHYKGESEAASGNRIRYRNAFFGAMQLFYAKHHPHNKLGQFLIAKAIPLLARRKEKAHSTVIPSVPTRSELNLLPIDLTPLTSSEPTPDTQLQSPLTPTTLPEGRNLLVTLAPDTYDSFLKLLVESEGRGCTFYTSRPDDGIILGPATVLPL